MQFIEICVELKVYRQTSITKRYRSVKSLKTQVTRHLSQIVSSEILNISRIKKQQQEDEYIIPPNFFEIAKESILVEFPYWPQNELVAKQFLSKFHQFTNQKFQVTIKWITKKVKSLFSLKDKNPYPTCQIYKGTCVCDEIYIGETIRNADI